MEQPKEFGPLSLAYWFDQRSEELPFDGVIWPRLIAIRNAASQRYSAPKRETGQRKAYPWDTLLLGGLGGGMPGHSGRPEFIWNRSAVVVPLVTGDTPVLRQVSALDGLRQQQQEDAQGGGGEAERLDRMLEAVLQLFGDGCIFLNLVSWSGGLGGNG
jgi:hypothetical protein